MLTLTSRQVFGYVDPATPVGYNISPGVQQLITSLMTLGAFVGSLAAGKLVFGLSFFYAKICRANCSRPFSKAGIMDGMSPLCSLRRHHDGHNPSSRSLRRQTFHRLRKRILHDILSTVSPGISSRANPLTTTC
jgi:hypothetical protein